MLLYTAGMVTTQ